MLIRVVFSCLLIFSFSAFGAKPKQIQPQILAKDCGSALEPADLSFPALSLVAKSNIAMPQRAAYFEMLDRDRALLRWLNLNGRKDYKGLSEREHRLLLADAQSILSRRFSLSDADALPSNSRDSEWYELAARGEILARNLWRISKSDDTILATMRDSGEVDRLKNPFRGDDFLRSPAPWSVHGFNVGISGKNKDRLLYGDFAIKYSKPLQSSDFDYRVSHLTRNGDRQSVKLPNGRGATFRIAGIYVDEKARAIRYAILRETAKVAEIFYVNFYFPEEELRGFEYTKNIYVEKTRIALPKDEYFLASSFNAAIPNTFLVGKNNKLLAVQYGNQNVVSYDVPVSAGRNVVFGEFFNGSASATGRVLKLWIEGSARDTQLEYAIGR